MGFFGGRVWRLQEPASAGLLLQFWCNGALYTIPRMSHHARFLTLCAPRHPVPQSLASKISPGLNLRLPDARGRTNLRDDFMIGAPVASTGGGTRRERQRAGRRRPGSMSDSAPTGFGRHGARAGARMLADRAPHRPRPTGRRQGRRLATLADGARSGPMASMGALDAAWASPRNPARFGPARKRLARSNTTPDVRVVWPSRAQAVGRKRMPSQRPAPLGSRSAARGVRHPPFS